MKFIYLILTLFLFQVGYAQHEFETVNRKKVSKLVRDKSADTYYPKLLDRFLADDTTLTNAEFRLLYYGFVFQPSYSGYPNLQQKEIHDALNKNNFDEAVKRCNEILKKYPINLFANYNLGLALFLKDTTDAQSKLYQNRFFNILKAIISSGDGKTCKTAFKTIFISDEYLVMYKYFEIITFKGQALEGDCDKMSVAPSDYFNASYMYFDTSETLRNMKKMFGN